MLFSFPRRDLTFTLLHEEVMCTYNATTPSHKSHHQKTPGLLWGVQESLLESVPVPCLVRIPKVPPAFCCTANSFLMLSDPHSWSSRHPQVFNDGPLDARKGWRSVELHPSGASFGPQHN